MDGWMQEKTTIPCGIDVGRGLLIWIHQHAKFYVVSSKGFVSKCIETWKCGERTDRRTIINVDKLRLSHLDTSTCQNIDFSSKWFVRNIKTQPQSHRQLGRRMNVWKDNNTHRLRCRLRVKSSGYISMPNFMAFLPSDLSANEHKPENAMN